MEKKRLTDGPCPWATPSSINLHRALQVRDLAPARHLGGGRHSAQTEAIASRTSLQEGRRSQSAGAAPNSQVPPHFSTLGPRAPPAPLSSARTARSLSQTRPGCSRKSRRSSAAPGAPAPPHGAAREQRRRRAGPRRSCRSLVGAERRSGAAAPAAGGAAGQAVLAKGAGSPLPQATRQLAPPATRLPTPATGLPASCPRPAGRQGGGAGGTVLGALLQDPHCGGAGAGSWRHRFAPAGAAPADHFHFHFSDS